MRNTGTCSDLNSCIVFSYVSHLLYCEAYGLLLTASLFANGSNYMYCLGSQKGFMEVVLLVLLLFYFGFGF